MKTKITLIGMLLLVVTMSFAQKTAETNSQPYHQFSFDAGYTFSSLKENQNPSRPLFAGDGVNIGISHRYGDRFGVITRFGFATGSLDQSGLQAFVDDWRPVPPKYRSEAIKTNWSQLSLMTGPSVKLGKKHQLEFNALAGIGFNPSPNTIRVDSYDQDVFLKTVYEAKDKSVVGMWQVNASYKLALLSKTGKWLRIIGGYGSNGATIGFGVNIADRDCRGALCPRCEGPGCIPY